MAAPAPDPQGPAYSIAALARIPVRDGMKASEIAYLCNSQAHTAETLAGVIDQQAHALQGIMARTQGNMWDAFRARQAARRATRPMRQAADRIRAGAASSRACWRVTSQVFASVMNPTPKRQRKGPDWTK